MRCLQLDVGNTSAKWRWVDTGGVQQRGSFKRGALQQVCEEWQRLDPPDQVWIASVADADFEQALSDAVAQLWSLAPWLPRTPASTAGLQNSYAEPARMGIDRWLAMLGAWQVLPDTPLCVVDAGSALTIDLIGANGHHRGGYIIPGPQLMESALLRDTDRVRFDLAGEYRLDPGTCTAEAVRHGIAAAQSGAVRLIQERFGEPEMATVYSGGAGEVIKSLLEDPGPFRPDLVFEGLAMLAAEAGLTDSS